MEEEDKNSGKYLGEFKRVRRNFLLISYGFFTKRTNMCFLAKKNYKYDKRNVKYVFNNNKIHLN